jgi:deazaflavin-dependent oxidoreductase (nitroreductase family)
VGRLGADDGILEHVGRKSGTQFRTPLTVFTTDIDGQAGVAILLTYGPNRDWLKNITAAGGGRIKRYGKTFSVQDPRGCRSSRRCCSHAQTDPGPDRALGDRGEWHVAKEVLVQ